MKENADKARSQNAAELEKLLRESAEQSFRLRFQLSMGQMEGVKKLRLLRKERARMLTVLRERELHPELAPSQTEARPAAKKSAAKPKPAARVKPAAKVKTAAKPAASAKPKAAKTRKSGERLATKG
jgi:large subunit ribosomal protein L29